MHEAQDGVLERVQGQCLARGRHTTASVLRRPFCRRGHHSHHRRRSLALFLVRVLLVAVACLALRFGGSRRVLELRSLYGYLWEFRVYGVLGLRGMVWVWVCRVFKVISGVYFGGGGLFRGVSGHLP